METLGLYLHIPFCKSKCAYCDFYSLAGSEEKMDAYVQALERELALRAGDAAGETVETVYFGGGTPSYLGAQRLVHLLETVRAHYTLAPGAEITLEANPDSAEAGALGALHAAGFNRLSLGMQSARDEELRAVGRIHTHAQTVRAVESARAAGFGNVSLDLIYALPGQSAAQWRANLEAALALEPEHLSCYGLKVEPGTPLFRRREPGIADEETQAAMYLQTAETLNARGWTHYEISNFCRAGRASRHNLRYWRLEPYLGFGPGAHSDHHGERFARARSLEAYLRGEEQYSERSRPDAAERAEEYVMLGLRTAQGIARGELARRGLDVAAAEPFLRRCEQEGLGCSAEGRFALTPRGWLVSNAVIVELLERLGL